MRSYFKRLWERVRFWWQPRYELQLAVDQPADLPVHVIYLLGNKEKQWAAVFKCPCGCGEAVWLNLLPAADRPTWRVTKHRTGSFSIYPSVWRQVGCRSHFYVRRGQLLWS